jgi:hypothetical protein
LAQPLDLDGREFLGCQRRYEGAVANTLIAAIGGQP